EPRVGEKLEEAVALVLVERRQVEMMLRMSGEEIGERELQRPRGGESDVQVHAAQLRRERLRRDAIAELPTGGVIGLAEREDREAALGELRLREHGRVSRAVEHNVLVHLVAQDVAAVRAQDRRELVEIGST